MSALGREAAIAVFDYPGLGAQSGVGAWTGYHAKVQESSAYCSAGFVALGGQMAASSWPYPESGRRPLLLTN